VRVAISLAGVDACDVRFPGDPRLGEVLRGHDRALELAEPAADRGIIM
jgi:hypothetical protein